MPLENLDGTIGLNSRFNGKQKDLLNYQRKVMRKRRLCEHIRVKMKKKREQNFCETKFLQTKFLRENGVRKDSEKTVVSELNHHQISVIVE